MHGACHNTRMCTHARCHDSEASLIRRRLTIRVHDLARLLHQAFVKNGEKNEQEMRRLPCQRFPGHASRRDEEGGGSLFQHVDAGAGAEVLGADRMQLVEEADPHSAGALRWSARAVRRGGELACQPALTPTCFGIALSCVAQAKTHNCRGFDLDGRGQTHPDPRGGTKLGWP